MEEENEEDVLEGTVEGDEPILTEMEVEEASMEEQVVVETSENNNFVEQEAQQAEVETNSGASQAATNAKTLR